MAGATQLVAEDINQLTGRGIPIIGELAKPFGVSDSEVKNSSSPARSASRPSSWRSSTAIAVEPKWEDRTGDNGCFHYGLHGFTEDIPVF